MQVLFLCKYVNHFSFNFQGLDDLHYQLLTLESLVYEVNEPNITLSQLQTMSNLDQSKLLMSKVKPLIETLKI